MADLYLTTTHPHPEGVCELLRLWAARDRAGVHRLCESPEEADVILMAEGLGTAQIAGQLYMSESTAKTHVSRIYQKLGATNRAQALVTSMRLGLLSSVQPSCRYTPASTYQYEADRGL